MGIGYKGIRATPYTLIPDLPLLTLSFISSNLFKAMAELLPEQRTTK